MEVENDEVKNLKRKAIEVPVGETDTLEIMPLGLRSTN